MHNRVERGVECVVERYIVATSSCCEIVDGKSNSIVCVIFTVNVRILCTYIMLSNKKKEIKNFFAALERNIITKTLQNSTSILER